MDFNALLEARRSVRAFDDTKAVTKEQIKTLIEAGIRLLPGKIRRLPDTTVTE